MSFAEETVTILLGAATLVLLSLHTLVNCRNQLEAWRANNYRALLFEGKSKLYSLAGAVGSTFSATYYGATTIYGHLYRGWFLLFLLVALIISIPLVRAIIDAAHQKGYRHDRRSNLLLELIKAEYGHEMLHAACTLYLLIYTLLLAEEIAVTRLVLATIFPHQPIIMAVLLATLCMVAATYIRWGGFKAILIADFEQLKLLFPFMIALAFLALRRPESLSSAAIFTPHASSSPAAIIFGLMLLVAWLVAPVDFYSRLNFKITPAQRAVVEEKNFATYALVLVIIAFAAGSTFGMLLPSSFSQSRSPSDFTSSGIGILVEGGSRATSIIFFASLFCMTFTTLNTLLFTLFQVGAYAPRGWPRLRNLSRILLFSILLSCALLPDSVSAMGLFMGALLVIPLSVVIGVLVKPLRAAMRPAPIYIFCSALAASLIFAFSYERIKLDFGAHHIIGGIMLAGISAGAVISIIIQALRRRLHG